MPPAKKHVSPLEWHKASVDFTKSIQSLSEKNSEGPFDAILAVGRGGFAIACYVSNHLGIRKVASVTLGSYTGTSKVSDIKEIVPVSEGVEDSPRLLVVDELVDGGHTMAWLRQKFPTATLAAVYAKPKGMSSVNLFGVPIPQEEWIVFPWEPDFEIEK